MREFKETLERIKQEEASVSQLFGGDGRAAKRDGSPEYKRKLLEAATFLNEVFDGDRKIWQLKEALTTGDFPLLFGDIIDRQMLADYKIRPKSWPAYARRGTVPDFRLVNRFAVDGAEAALAAVGQGDQYPETSMSDTRYQYQVGKYGKRIAFAWESMVNDDLDGLKTLPARFSRSALRAEEKFATQLFADANGPHATLFSAGNKNIINTTNGSVNGNNPPLTITGLQSGLTVLWNQLDKDGEPILVDAVVLVVPPGLQLTAENILNSTELWLNAEGGGTAAAQVHVLNWMKNRTKVAVNPYLPIVSSTANGKTSWYLFADASADDRTALEMGFLRGHEDPQIFTKLADSSMLGGGVTDPSEGDFDTDSIQYKIRHVFGGTRLDVKMAAASNGSGV